MESNFKNISIVTKQYDPKNKWTESKKNFVGYIQIHDDYIKIFDQKTIDFIRSEKSKIGVEPKESWLHIGSYSEIKIEIKNEVGDKNGTR